MRQIHVGREANTRCPCTVPLIAPQGEGVSLHLVPVEVYIRLTPQALFNTIESDVNAWVQLWRYPQSSFSFYSCEEGEWEIDRHEASSDQQNDLSS